MTTLLGAAGSSLVGIADETSRTVLGLPVPDTRPVFLAVLTVHVAAGLTSVACGAAAALSRKGQIRHVRAGRLYVRALVVVAATALGLAVLRWPHDLHLAALATLTAILALVGRRARPRTPGASPTAHVVGLGGSFIVLLTGFYVDNGPQLPGWRHLPAWALWTLPTLIGAPIILRSLRAHRAPGSARATATG